MLGLVRTDKWIEKWHDDPIKVCENLEPYFKSFNSKTIHQILVLNGMYRHPNINKEKFTRFLDKAYSIVANEHKLLMKEWNGPNIPIFIFPSDSTNHRIKKEYNGKSGVAFKDKLFLFLSDSNQEKDIRALFIHEYNHVCRLTHYLKEEENFTLLDTIILEGLAENAVLERLGDKYLAPWTSYYSTSKQRNLWESMVKPNKHITTNTTKHQKILYGLGNIPKMTGYVVGYHLVYNYIKENQASVKELLMMDSENIAKI